MKSFDKSLSKKVETVRLLRLDGVRDSGLNSQTGRKSQVSMKRNEHLKNAPTSHTLSRNQQHGLGSVRQFFAVLLLVLAGLTCMLAVS